VWTKRRAAALLFIILLCGGGCATPPEDPAARAAFEEANDPLEPLNRTTFAVNRVLDDAVFQPVARTYRTVLPQQVRDSVRNVLDNLDAPVVFVNNVLQGEFDRAGRTFARFAFNSTLGMAGLFDFAGTFGLKKESGDFGQTLFAWGVPEGPYLMLPIFGPSSPRDAIGMVTDSYIDPFRYYNLTNGDPTPSALEDPNLYRTVFDGIDKRAGALDEVDAIEKNAVDYYAELRSYYRQNRAKEVRHGAAPPVSPAEDIYQDPGQKAAPSDH
jgi:phospholipid-binding lipoprotein MlaA